jgi:hypothetical protein
MDPEICESIMGHWFKEKSVSERYGRISNEELLQAVDSMTFDHGASEILVGSRSAETFGKDVRKMCAKAGMQKNQGGAANS